MKRQMFSRGGAASFPDLDGSGGVTRKDILIGRGVQGLALGGPPMMDPNMMPPAGPPMAPPQMGPEQALAGAEAQGQEMGMMAAEGVMQNIDGAQDYQSLIDGIRGNQQPLEARYAELGGIVGEQDAMQTPESVLALTQPAIMMTEEGAVNSGIGELMQGIAGDTSMEGQMGEGVGGLMMAQAPEPAMQAPMMEAGNTPPVNFRQGGPVEVRGYAGGGETAIDIASRDLSKYKDFLTGGFDGTARAAELQKQREMSQSQMLFDISQAALQFAGNTQGGSIAERLANSAAAAQLPQRIGERAAGMLSAEQAQTAEKRQLDMAARQAALQGGQAEAGFAQKLKIAQAGRTPTKTDFVKLYGIQGGKLVATRDFDRNKPEDLKQLNLLSKNMQGPVGDDGQATPTPETGIQYFDIKGLEPYQSALIKAQEIEADIRLRGLPTELYTFSEETVIDKGTENEKTYAAGTAANLTQVQANQVPTVKKFAANPENYVDWFKLDGTSATTLNIGTVAGAQQAEKYAKEGSGWTTNPTAYQSTIETKARIEVLNAAAGIDVEAAATFFDRAKTLKTMDFTDRKEAAETAAILALTMQENKFDFTSLRDQTLQGYKVDLQGGQAAIDEMLLDLKGVQGKEMAELRATLQDRNTRLTGEINIANSLELFGAKSLFEIKKMDKGVLQDKELKLYSQGLLDASRKDQNVFTATQSALGRVAEKDMAIFTTNARAALQDDAQFATMEEGQRNRLFTAGQAVLDRAQREKFKRMDIQSATSLQAARLQAQAVLSGNSLRSAEGIAAANRFARAALQDDQQAATAVENALKIAASKDQQVTEQEFKLILQKTGADLNLDAAQLDRAFKAGESALTRAHQNSMQEASLSAQALNAALNRAATEKNLLTSQEWKEMMQEEADKLNVSEADKKRLFAAGQSLLERTAREGLQLGSQDHDKAMQVTRIAADVAKQDTSINATALENVLDRAAAETRGLNSQEAAAALQEERLDFQGDQADLNRADAKFNNLVQNNLTEKGLDLRAAIAGETHARGVVSNNIAQQTLDMKSAFGTGAKSLFQKVALGQEGYEGIMEKYGDGKTNREETALVEGSILQWVAPKSGSNYNESTKTLSQPVRTPLTTDMLAALQKRQLQGLPVPAVNFTPVLNYDNKSPMAASFQQADMLSPYAFGLSGEAFGSDAWFKNLVNKATEAGTGGLWGTWFPDTKAAIKSVENLNQEFMSFFMAASDIRDSVFQAKELKNLVPKPAAFWEGEEDAQEAAKVLYARLDRQIMLNNRAIEDDETYLKSTGNDSVSKLRRYKPQLEALRHGYGILAGIANASEGQTMEDATQQQALTEQLDALVAPRD